MPLLEGQTGYVATVTTFVTASFTTLPPSSTAAWCFGRVIFKSISGEHCRILNVQLFQILVIRWLRSISGDLYLRLFQPEKIHELTLHLALHDVALLKEQMLQTSKKLQMSKYCLNKNAPGFASSDNYNNNIYIYSYEVCDIRQLAVDN